MSTSVRITTGDWPAPPAGTLKYNERGLEDAKSFAERYGVHVSLPPESGDRTPLVLVLGWYGSSLPLLAQYFAFLRQVIVATEQSFGRGKRVGRLFGFWALIRDAVALSGRIRHGCGDMSAQTVAACSKGKISNMAIFTSLIKSKLYLLFSFC